MKVLDVIPIARGIFAETLSYFTAEHEISPGSLLTVPLASRNVPAVLMSVRDIRESKASLKLASYALRRIEGVKARNFFLPEFITASQKTAHLQAGATGGVLSSFTPQAILEKPPEIPFKKRTRKGVFTPSLIQTDPGEREAHYRSLVRESFARKESVFIIFPTVQELENMRPSLEKGISQHTVILNAGFSKKKTRGLWEDAVVREHPILVLSTATFLSLPRHDIGTIIVEGEHSRFYKSGIRPFADARLFAELLAKELSLSFVLADTVLRIETVVRFERLFKFSLLPQHMQIPSAAETKLISMRKKPDEEKTFSVISEELKRLIQTIVEKKSQLFLFTLRRGLSPITLCGDCGTVVACNNCAGPVTLHKGKEINYFLCHRCGERRSAEEGCASCGGWKLQNVGIGIELIEKILKRAFPSLPLFRLDKDFTKTETAALASMERFEETPGSILLGTEVALFYLKKPVEYSAIVSLDSLFAVPDFQIEEKVFSLISSIRVKTRRVMLIQTRNIETETMETAASGDFKLFFERELERRKMLEYPPFSTLIKATAQGRKESAVREMTAFTERFKSYDPQVFPAFIPTIKGKYILHALIKVPVTSWPDSVLIDMLKASSPSIKIQVDPENAI